MIKLTESLLYVGTAFFIILRVTSTLLANERGYLILSCYIDEGPEA